MIITVKDLKNRLEGVTGADDAISARLDAIEAVIRKYTNNNFQIREIRIVGKSDGFNVYGSPRCFSVGDTVQISQSGVNDGLYTVASVSEDRLVLDKPLFEAPLNLVTKIQYPADVIQCACDLYEWKQKFGGKIGLKSETISRHSVTFEDSATLFMGYPVGILKGLNLYRKARC